MLKIFEKIETGISWFVKILDKGLIVLYFLHVLGKTLNFFIRECKKLKQGKFKVSDVDDLTAKEVTTDEQNNNEDN